MKTAGCSSRPRAPVRPTVRANSAARSGWNCWPRARQQSSSAAGRRDCVDLSLIRPYPLQHLLDVSNRGFRLDAVAEIEDQTAFGVVRQHVVDRGIERGAAGDQHQRIEIALNGDVVLHAFTD